MGISTATKTMMRPAEAAGYLGLSKQFLAKTRCYGGGPLFSKCGKAVLYNRADLDAWVAERRRSSTSDNGQ